MTVQVVAQVRGLLERFQMQIAQQIQQVAAQQQQQQVVHHMLLQQVLAQQHEQRALLKQWPMSGGPEPGDSPQAHARPAACPWLLPAVQASQHAQPPMLHLPPLLQSLPQPQPRHPGRQPTAPPQHMPQEPPQELPQEKKCSPPPPGAADEVNQVLLGNADKEVIYVPKAATSERETPEKISTSPETVAEADTHHEEVEEVIATPTPSVAAEESTSAGTEAMPSPGEVSVGSSEEPPPPSDVPVSEEAEPSEASRRGVRHPRQTGGRGSLSWRPVIRSMGKTGPRNSEEVETADEKPRRYSHAKKEKGNWEWRPTTRSTA